MRLIDVDALIEAMKKTEFEYENAMTCPSWWSAFNVISEQPTAYSVDKVVEELEKSSKWVNETNEYGDDDGSDYISLSKAIEIVKQGGVSDDVCEWRLCDEEANVYDTSCRNPHILIKGTPKENNYEYCPYCGKKIKVVE